MNEDIGEAVFVIKADDSQATSTLNDWSKKLSNFSGEGASATSNLAGSFENLRSSIANLATAHYALSGTASAIKSVTDAYGQYEASMNGVKAVAQATGNDISQTFGSIKQITSSGLITQDDAAAAMKNLQQYGYSVEQATQMITVMADAAAYGRQTNYTLSEAVRVTTDGIRTENSVLSDASGITTNIAKMQENYAKELGKTTNELTQSEKAQAVYNGFLEEGKISAGNAAEYSNTLAGSQQKLDTSLNEVKRTIGAAFSSLSPFIKSIAEWISKNKELVAGILIFVGILTAGAGLVSAIKVAVSAIGVLTKTLGAFSVISKIATLGIVGLIAGVATIGMMSSATNTIKSLSDSISDATAATDDGANALDNLGEVASDSANQIANLNQQLAKLERDYRRDLKQIAVNHQENLQTLTQQIEEANIDYKRAIDERTAEFNVTLAEQEKSHQETVDELMTQLAFLQRYNNDYNKQKLLQVQSALQMEEVLYQRQTEAQKAELEIQNEADKQKYEQKMQSLQQELDDEMAFMEKHREALNSVRDVILLDEIESLNERYAEQQASYTKQIAEAKISGAEIGNGLGENITDALEKSMEKLDLSKQGIEIGEQIMNGIGKGLESAGTAVWDWLKQGGIVKNIYDLINPTTTKGQKSSLGGWATGGYTGRGAPDEIAGIVHRGEYVVPASQVDQTTGMPMTTSNNITINLSGVLADSPQAKRQLGMELAKAVEQVMKSRLAKTGGNL